MGRHLAATHSGVWLTMSVICSAGKITALPLPGPGGGHGIVTQRCLQGCQRCVCPFPSEYCMGGMVLPTSDPFS